MITKQVQIIVVYFLSLLFMSTNIVGEMALNVEVEIISHEFIDSRVVGDSFYYRITLQNLGSEIINDTLKVYIQNPRDVIIEGVREYSILINLNETLSINATGEKPNEFAIFPFETFGDYKLVINSTKAIEFYRRFTVIKPDGIHNVYIREPISFNYVFDAMPKWQYSLSKQREEVNSKMSDTNTELLRLTRQLQSSTDLIKLATIAMLVVAFANLLAFVYGVEKIKPVLSGIIQMVVWVTLVVLALFIASLIISIFAS